MGRGIKARQGLGKGNLIASAFSIHPSPYPLPVRGEGIPARNAGGQGTNHLKEERILQTLIAQRLAIGRTQVPSPLTGRG